ncbi:hypothetical protein P154DRAFT_17211 [Amniculicola lignicola CBS 123094]|uniref:Autophagy-related protein 1 n=1 Tax=Amniculicola lignicola CBS 123094 TaxID=1392246 RepID=A0A6A5X5N7_9PLEO|nr:hypothetical protein P154DRAFT_17211 [Amniculicola lignicola CBS 123094]
MGRVPGFTFPASQTALSTTDPTFKSTRPQIQLQTPTSSTTPSPELKTVFATSTDISGRSERRDFLSKTFSTPPPDSPSRIRASTMSDRIQDPRILHDSGAITPPFTPTGPSHGHSHSASSAYSLTGSLSSLRRGDSTASTGSRRGILVEEKEQPGSTELKKFPYWETDYEITDKKKPLGSGLWSDVYQATPCLPTLSSDETPSSALSGNGTNPTPPITPTRFRKASLTQDGLPNLPPAYAIKVPASRSAKAVLSFEAKTLSYLSRFPDSDKYTVPFYGQDMRSEALVLKAMDCTLESWIDTHLNTLSEPLRAQKLAQVFPDLALQLLNGLEWMHDHGCIHADIKPSNILLSPEPPTLSSTPPVPRLVYSDFSSASLSTLTASDQDPTTKPPPAPLGGGTWDYLDPILLTKPSPPPCAASDLWGLAITLLCLVLGCSPFDAEGTNVYRRREVIKQGVPMAYLRHGDLEMRNGRRGLADEMIEGEEKMRG